MFVITAGYVGYDASQNQHVEEIKGHTIELKTLSAKTDAVQAIQDLKLVKLID